MKIVVDGDACPVKEEAISLAYRYQIPIKIYIDVSHIVEDDYATIVYCDIGRDSVDFSVLKDIVKGDILITQDYELAGFALAKDVYCFNFYGIEYTKETIDQLLFSRYVSFKARKQGFRQYQKPRTSNDNTVFLKNIDDFLKQVYNDKR